MEGWVHNKEGRRGVTCTKHTRVSAPAQGLYPPPPPVKSTTDGAGSVDVVSDKSLVGRMSRPCDIEEARAGGGGGGR